MRILDRYLIKHLLIPVVFCSFTLIFLVIIADLFDHLSELIKNKTALFDIARYYLHLIPFSFVQTVPWATFLGTVFLLVNLNTHNEILAMKVAGLNISKITLPILYVGFLIGIASFLVNDRLVPWTFKQAKTLLEERIERPANPHVDSVPVIHNFTFFSAANRLYYAKKFNLQSSALEGVIVIFYDQAKRVARKIFAKSARWEADAWRFEQVTDYETLPAGKIRGEPRVYAERKYPEISESPQEFISASSDIAFLSYRELKHYIERLKENDLKAYPEMVELHYKLSSPWHSLIMMFIAILFLTVARRKKVIALNMVYCLGLVFSFHVLGALSLALGKVGNLPPFLSAWTSNLVFSVGSIFFLDRAND